MLTLNLNLLYTVVNILVLFLLLRKFLYKPVMNIIAQRQKQVDDALTARELIKLTVLETAPETPREMAATLAEATGADCVQVIGSKFVLYLQKKKDSAYADLLK